MKIAITKVYEVNTTFLSFLFHNIDEMPDNFLKFTDILENELQNYAEDEIYYKNVKELYEKMKCILKQHVMSFQKTLDKKEK